MKVEYLQFDKSHLNTENMTYKFIESLIEPVSLLKKATGISFFKSRTRKSLEDLDRKKSITSITHLNMHK